MIDVFDYRKEYKNLYAREKKSIEINISRITLIVIKRKGV